MKGQDYGLHDDVLLSWICLIPSCSLRMLLLSQTGMHISCKTLADGLKAIVLSYIYSAGSHWQHDSVFMRILPFLLQLHALQLFFLGFSQAPCTPMCTLPL